MTSGAVAGMVFVPDGVGNASWADPISFGLSPWTISGNNIYRSSGKVGIGIQAGSKELDVNGNMAVNDLICGSTRSSSFGYLTLQGSELTNSSRITIGKNGVEGTNSIKLIANSNDGEIEFFTGGLPKATMRSDEFIVGFPTSDGSRLMDLRVNGKIWTNEIEVTTSVWWDKVLSKNYQLRSLKEVELFINENSHLPDLPSEKEVLENGINLGEMDGLLLKKVEELTLYMIAQQKVIDELTEKVHNLEAK